MCRDAGGGRVGGVEGGDGVGGGEGDGVDGDDEEDDGDGGGDEAGDGVWKDSLRSLDVDEAEDEDEVNELMSDWGSRGVEVRIKLGWLRLVCLFSVGLFMNK